LEQPFAAVGSDRSESQHHLVLEHSAEVLFAATDVVLEVIALVLESVEGPIFVLPRLRGAMSTAKKQGISGLRWLNFLSVNSCYTKLFLTTPSLPRHPIEKGIYTAGIAVKIRVDCP
jgi:hypothetical protein